MRTDDIRCVTLGGAGFLAGLQVGCVKYLEEIRVLENVHTFVGTSSGSIISLGLMLGLSSAEQARLLASCSEFEFNCIDRLFETRGMDDGANIRRMVGRVLQSGGLPENTTFRALHAHTHKTLLVNAANITDSRIDTFSHVTDPDMEVRLAIRMSCALPILVTPIEYKGKTYVDAAFYKTLHAPPELMPRDGKNLMVHMTHLINVGKCLEGSDGDFLAYLTQLINSFATFVFTDTNTVRPGGPLDVLVCLCMQPGYSIEELFIKTDDARMNAQVDLGYARIKAFFEDSMADSGGSKGGLDERDDDAGNDKDDTEVHLSLAVDEGARDGTACGSVAPAHGRRRNEVLHDVPTRIDQPRQEDV
jgi:hypothetical protein